MPKLFQAFLESSDTPGAGRHPLLFQDVDGVLNRYVEGTPELDPALLRNLKGTLDSTGADLVLSTQWRKYRDHRLRLQEALQQSGIPAERIVGETPSLCGGPYCRAKEIKEFLTARGELETRWAAVDDVDLSVQDPEFMKGHFVKTDPLRGLTAAKASELQETLKADTEPSRLSFLRAL
ncbi:unnamed protein product [Effrenium voratum]|uniref:Uncharacterized protein n=1 Tax=Effrenium voratum TaxID=2562239 RepID=A0AA36IJK3_9DINO|nr:unnamed protein product [Effrenium voratum]|mmetsp:Transcript_114186/g.271802  ORF Transcript_114186/g.271802 Transcript_114186/m.271802 type:complete len:179 (-) Transcript_114186:20-556(-)